MSLYVGAVLGGPEHLAHPIRRTISEISEAVEKHGGKNRPASEYSVDFVFHVPGTLQRLTFNAVRTGRFSNEERILQVQIPVPEDLISETPDRGQLVKLLADALHLAAHYFHKRSLQFDEQQCLGLINQVGKSAL